MKYMVMFLLVIISILVICIFRQEKKLRLKEEVQPDRDPVYDEIWQAVNTIHVNACLSEEEAKTRSLKDKQWEIITACEHILKVIKDK